MTKHHRSGALDRRGFMARVALGGAALTAGLPARAGKPAASAAPLSATRAMKPRRSKALES